jgi:PleD family two-component response regulator
MKIRSTSRRPVGPNSTSTTSPADAAIILANRLPQELKENPIFWNEAPLEITISYGIVTIEPGIDAQDAMDMADSEMYQHKLQSKRD